MNDKWIYVQQKTKLKIEYSMTSITKGAFKGLFLRHFLCVSLLTVKKD